MTGVCHSGQAEGLIRNPGGVRLSREFRLVMSETEVGAPFDQSKNVPDATSASGTFQATD